MFFRPGHGVGGQVKAAMGLEDKIKTVEELGRLIAQLKAEGKKVVHCHGVFDLLHIGHIRYLGQAADMGDVLVVTVTPDEFVDKGPGHPAFNQQLRVEGIASLGVVDYAAINNWPTAEETLRLIQPDIYAKGSEFKNLEDMTGKIGAEAAVIEEIGAELRFTEDIVFSSTNLINRYLSAWPEEIQEYLKLFRQRHGLDEVLTQLDRLKSLKVMIVGDTILDEYQYVNAIGKSSKDPVLAAKYESEDIFAGGVLAVANHTANFVEKVKLVTVLGDGDRREEFIRSQLKSNVDPVFFTQENAPTIIKRRFVDGYSFNKLLEIYVMDDSGPSDAEDARLGRYIAEHGGDYDLIISSDFGHGAISANTVKALMDSARFLAVNTQANAGNRGFNLITKYSRMDFGCIANHEMRLATKMARGNIRPHMYRLARKLETNRFVVTTGRKGCIIWDKSDGYVHIPSLASAVVDRIGAGDAFFAVASLLAAQGTNTEVLGFLGNVVGGLAVEIIGNQKSIDALAVKKYVTSLMK